MLIDLRNEDCCTTFFTQILFSLCNNLEQHLWSVVRSKRRFEPRLASVLHKENLQNFEFLYIL
jgi:hypothetical protein